MFVSPRLCDDSVMAIEQSDEQPSRVLAVPWWAWVLAAGVAWLAGQLLMNLPPPDKATLATGIQIGMLGGFGFVLSWLGSISLVVLAAATGIRHAEARSLARRKVSNGGDDEVKPGPGLGLERVDTRRWSADLIKSLEWKRVEKLAALYLRALKFTVEEALPGAHGGADLRVYVPGSKSPGILVQCRAWSTWRIDVPRIRELAGMMAADEVDEGIFITTATFTRDAIDFARDANIGLIDGADLLSKLLDLPLEDRKRILTAVTDGDYTTPSCPTCGFKMVTRVEKSTGKAFWGCPRFPRCEATIQFRDSSVSP